ncbi:HPr family phosphocarrier protein [Candidatus Methylacidiphilum fumarolicum]|uniref:Phosphotransferase system HPr-related protein n=2 Tax=Candidatus Methylacidiphilum fumarolicum TaxID=591154 RepID=I0K0Z1_METFB|nr:HPr family phosphocarrier protein [Candidatus Methylacidiphilum fumarolicum]MBW6413970.1 HPr family phosphocarrier protein [Candidatus Methylacidiphilum fumarolicum]TFE70512.1 phosphocarrier protein HPr [Candidatus Methylacidiphilum fumarolicum]TFE74770.1 HPr family phosphocarrier protein [Candidatus Methylacidiphilum fumarolicum]TFE76016.1 HPr family phosphocarrier protein [Candidatus Methylacidiphilum fumarolicum]TFE76399.1 phosphocarrier protein HPr [Candidatus Methylacidiphilum fumaroli
MEPEAKESDSEKTSFSPVVREVLVQNKLGIHARPAAMFVKIANRYESDIKVEKDGEEVNGKSIMGVMLLAASMGSKLKITAVGPDAQQAVEALVNLVNNKFGENQ